MYKPLSQRLGYFNREYEERIGLINNKIKQCINDHNECLKLSLHRSRKKIKKMDEFEIKWNEIIKKFVKNKIGFEIIKVSILENIQYTGVYIKDFEDLENKGKSYKSRTFSDEVNYHYKSLFLYLVRHLFRPFGFEHNLLQFQ